MVIKLRRDDESGRAGFESCVVLDGNQADGVVAAVLHSLRVVLF